MNQILMPKPTAIWLVDNTSLTFEQIADFCNLHVLEIQSIADGEIGQGLRPLDPVAGGMLTRDEIDKGQNDPVYRLVARTPAIADLNLKPVKERRYTPLSRRRNRPKGIAWLLRHHPDLSDAQISRLIGTTRNTIVSVRDRTHWDAQNLEPMDPVILGLCAQSDLDREAAAARMSGRNAETGGEQDARQDAGQDAGQNAGQNAGEKEGAEPNGDAPATLAAGEREEEAVATPSDEAFGTIG